MDAEPKSPDAAESPKLYKIGELARLASKSVRALRLYEELGLLQPAGRSTGKFRLYNHDAVERVRWIEKLQNLDLSLPQIQSLVHSMSTGQRDDMVHLQTLFKGKLEDIHQKIRGLQDLEKDLLDALAYMSRCKACEIAHPECSDCGYQARPAPPLVSDAITLMTHRGSAP